MGLCGAALEMCVCVLHVKFVGGGGGIGIKCLVVFVIHENEQHHLGLSLHIYNIRRQMPARVLKTHNFSSVSIQMILVLFVLA